MTKRFIVNLFIWPLVGRWKSREKGNDYYYRRRVILTEIFRIFLEWSDKKRKGLSIKDCEEKQSEILGKRRRLPTSVQRLPPVTGRSSLTGAYIKVEKFSLGRPPLLLEEEEEEERKISLWMGKQPVEWHRRKGARPFPRGWYFFSLDTRHYAF